MCMIVRRERWLNWNSSRPRTPAERCYQPAVADPDFSYIKVKINSPDSHVCLSEDDGLHTFLLCTQVLSPHSLSLPSLSSISISFLYHFHPQSPLFLFLSLFVPFPSCLRCFLLAFVSGQISWLFNNERMKGTSSSLSFPNTFHSLLSPWTP